MANPLLDTEFLKKLDSDRNKTIYIRVVALDLDENPIDTLEGRANGGSITEDGNSAARRTCNLSILAQDLNINDAYWALKTKIKIYIGEKNNIDNNYPDIIWFLKGTFVLSSFNYSLSTTGYTINLSGRDKMSLLDGTLGGALPGPMNFSFPTSDSSDTGEISIKDIVTGIVHTYANEKLENIVINDLDSIFAKTCVLNKTENFLYAYLKVIDEKTLPNFGNIDKVNNSYIHTSVDVESTFVFYTPKNDLCPEAAENNYSIYTTNGQKYYIAKFTSGQIIGYKDTDLTYPDEEGEGLIGNVGETFTQVLDKIIQKFPEFEYFYDINGRFVFQKKSIYSFNKWGKNIESFQSAGFDFSNAYSFKNNNLVVSLNNTPDLSKIKNDYIIWGERKIDDTTVKVHMRYAIQEKPQLYHKLDEEIWYINEDFKDKYKDTFLLENKKYCDWREIIYQMQKDYYKNHLKPDFLNKLEQRNTYNIDDEKIVVYPKGRTNCEQYYIELNGFWRDLYQYNEVSQKYGWTELAIDKPDLLPYWLEFLDTQGEISLYSVNQIGQRQLVKNESNVVMVNYYEIPLYKLYPEGSEGYDSNLDGQIVNGYYQIPISQELADIILDGVAFVPQTAKDVIYNELSSGTYQQESISITSIPIYYLDTNQVIYIYDRDSRINGYYAISNISTQLQYDGMMSISCYAFPDNIY